MRVVLSRKGFDSTAGGGSSPILADGRMVSMPIPEPVPSPGSPTYEEVEVPGRVQMTYAELGARCGLAAATGPMHLDPDLIPDAKERAPGWKGALGQAGSAAGHLRKQSMSIGDLFLFFGRFAHVGGRGLRGQKSFHAIFGYLQVGQMVDIGAGEQPPPWLDGHPHLTHESQTVYKRHNMVFLARHRLDFAPDCPGWGVFHYDDALRMTPNDCDGLVWWELPDCFGPEAGATVSYLPASCWHPPEARRVRVEVIGNKQELVCKGNDAIAFWAKELVATSRRWSPF